MTIIFRNKYELAAERRQGINKAVADDVQKVFVGKTAAQLAALQRNIEAKLRKGEDGLDISYWESLLSQLKAHLARAPLRDKHKENLRKKLEVLKAEQAMPGPTEDSPAPLAHDEVKQERLNDHNRRLSMMKKAKSKMHGRRLEDQQQEEQFSFHSLDC